MTGPASEHADRAERLRIEQRRRWEQGDRAPVEALLADGAGPPDEDLVLDLLFREVDLREQLGERPQLDELLARFPDLAERVRRQFEFHEVFRTTPRPAALHDAKTVVRDPASARPEDAYAGPAAAVTGYELLAELGRGGMGVVYKARQLSLNRLVALKMVLGGAHAGSEAFARFQAEAQAVARLQHPNLIQIFEVGEYEGRPYFAMEYLDGGTLDDKIGDKPQSPRQSAQMAATLARAVQAIHQAGLVHRDLKPSNVLLASDGTPKIADFGLAKRLDAGAHTATGSVLGTPFYMAPEQAAGRTKEVGPLVDVYALGAILYEMLTGRPPFLAESSMEVIHQVVHDEPLPPTRLQRRVPRDLETICLKCLEKEPAKRYASAGALAEDLEAFLRGEPIQARPAGPLRRAWKWARRHPTTAALLAFATLAAVVLIAIGVVYNMHLEDALQAAKDRQEESRQLLVRLNVTGAARDLDEGDWLGALVWLAEALRLDEGKRDREDIHRLRLAAVLSRSPRLKQIWFHDGPVRWACFNADGTLVLTACQGGTARVWDAGTGEPVGAPMRHSGAVTYAEFSPKGDRVLTAADDGTARLWDVRTGKPLGGPLIHGAPLACARFSPSGRWVVTAGGNAAALLWDAETGKSLTTTFRHEDNLRWAAFSPDESLLLTCGDDGAARLWRRESGEAVGQPWKHAGPVEHVEFSPDGKLALTCSAAKEARLWRVPSGAAAGPPLRHGAAVRQGAFSRDSKLAVTASDDRTAQIWDTATCMPSVPALRHVSDVNRAEFSRDGSLVVTASDDNTVRVWEAKSGRLLPPLLPHTGTPQGATFCPRGRHVLCYSSDTLARLWELPQAGGGAAPAPGGKGASVEPRVAAFSPDGAFVVRAHGGRMAQVLQVEGQRPVGQAMAHGSDVLWVTFSPDGRRVATASDDNTAALWDAATGRLLVPPLRHRGRVHHVSFSGDGRFVATASEDDTARVWEAATGEPITPPLLHAGPVLRAEFVAGGALKTTCRDGTVSNWALEADRRPAGELRRLAELLGASRIEPGRGLLPLGPQELRERWEKIRPR